MHVVIISKRAANKRVKRGEKRPGTVSLQLRHMKCGVITILQTKEELFILQQLLETDQRKDYLINGRTTE